MPLIPKNSSMAGAWQFSASGGFDEVKLTLRTGSPPTSSILRVKPYLTGIKYAASDINSALERLKSIYEKAGLQVVLDAVTVIPEKKFTTVNLNFTETNTSELVSKGAVDRINLFFIEDFIGVGAGIIGIASGIPGSLGISGSYNGVLNSLDAHVINGKLNSKLLGETAAHEMGHWLGLFHTTERNGREFDPLGDTPECPNSNASIAAFGVRPSDCKDLDGTNLMFWAGSRVLDQSTLTSNQIHIINYSPIAQ